MRNISNNLHVYNYNVFINRTCMHAGCVSLRIVRAMGVFGFLGELYYNNKTITQFSKLLFDLSAITCILNVNLNL